MGRNKPNKAKSAAPDSGGATWLVVAPFRGIADVRLYPTSRMLTANCGHRAWLSPQGEDLAPTAYLVCMDCVGAEEMREWASGKKLFGVPGAFRAIRELHGDAFADLAQRGAGALGVQELHPEDL